MPIAPPCPIISVIDALLQSAQDQLNGGDPDAVGVLVGLARELICLTVGPADMILGSLISSLDAAAEDHPHLSQALSEIRAHAEIEWARYEGGCRAFPRCRVCVANGVQPECDDPGLDDDNDPDGPW